MKELPVGWAWSNLGEVCIAMGGATPSKEDATFWDQGTIPWVSPKDMKARVITSSEDRVTEKALGQLSLIPVGSLLIVVRSGILSRTLPVAVTACPVTVNQDMRAFIPRPGLSADFLAWQLIGKEREILDATAKDGTTVASIEAPAFAAFPIAIAPTAEQTRIVAKLDELLSGLDAGVAELKAPQRKLQRYRQSLLKAAVDGALTADWRRQHPPTETGADLLSRILRERRSRWEAQQLARYTAQNKPPPKGWKDKYPEPTAPNTNDLPSLPESWVWATTQLVGEVLLGRQRAPQFLTGEYPRRYLRVANIKDDRIDFSDLETMDFDPVHFEKYRLESGDILVSEGQSPELVGQSAIFGGFGEPLCFQKTLHRFRASPAVACSKFAQIVFRSHVASGLFRKLASITTNIAHLTLEKFVDAPFPLPPLSEQREIIERMEAMESQASVIRKALSQGVRSSAAQRQNLLRAAFRGELVPQDPTDEPASVLLARLRAERTGMKSSRAPRKSSGRQGAAP